jgi:two-component sensor histidine kinase
LFIAPSNGQNTNLEEKIKEIDSLMYSQRVYIVIPKIDSLLAKELPISKELHLKTCKLITLVHIEKLETALNYANQLLRNKYLKGADLIATRLQKGLIFGLLNRLDEMKVELDFVKDYYNNPKISKDELYGEYLIRLATWYRAQNLNNEAATYSEEAIEFGNRKNYSNVEAVGLVLTALYKYKTKDKEYIQYRLRALKNLKKTGNFHAMGWTYAHLYHKYKNDNQVKLAFSYLDSSLLFSKKVKYFRSMASSYKILSDYHENEGNKGKALDYYKLFKMASDSSALRTESRKVEEIQSKYNFEKAEQLTKETEIKRKNTTYLLILICVILLITIVSLSITKQKNKRIKATEKEVNQKLKEQEFLLKELNHRVNNNLALILSLVKFQYYEIDEPKYKDKFQSLEHRIKTIAAAHEQLLYSKENLEGEEYDVQEYLSKITNALISISTKKVQINFVAKNINL